MENSSVIYRALGYIQPNRVKIIGAQIAMILGTLAGLSIPMLLGMLFDRTYPILPIVLLMICAEMVSAVAGCIRRTPTVGLAEPNGRDAERAAGNISF